MPIIDGSSPLEDGVTAEARTGADATTQGTQDNSLLDPERLLRLARESDRFALTFAQQNWLPAWDRSYKAFRSEHFSGSKYASDEYKHRSRLFRPKTRAAVNKDMGATAASLFATINAVTVTAGDETNDMEKANAAVQQELINYRLDRTSGKNAIPWFLTSMGARQDALIAGICCSKQYWEYREKVRVDRVIERDDDTGVETEREVENKTVVRDKPCIDLIPPENVGLHPAAHWMDPVNDGVFFNVWYPMDLGEIRAMMKDKRFPWREVTDKQILKARVQQFETGQVRRAREGGKDRLNDQRSGVSEFDVCWVVERFLRIEGEDYCFWTLADQALLCDPTPTEEVYPAFGGERPYKLGFGNLEAHRVVPQSKVEESQPIQQEINDTVNLRLDNVKEALKPLTLVKRGKKVDIERLKRRGHNTTLLVDDPETDIKFDRPTDVSASAYTEMERLNVDFDDLMGVFNSGSVQTNRSLNETVGGMKLLSGAANAQTEFNTRVWVETWVEPVLSQLAKLEAYYESDERVLALAAKRAKMFQKFGTDEVTDEMLQNEVYVRVSAGVGAADPMQKLSKMDAAVKVFTPIAMASPEFKTGEIRPNMEEFANEIFGNAGIRDGFNRLFIKGPPTMQPPGADAAPAGPSPEELAATHADNEAERASRERIAKMNNQTKIASQLIGHKADERDQKRVHRHEGRHKFVDVMADALREQHQAADRKVQAQARLSGQNGPAAPQQ